MTVIAITGISGHLGQRLLQVLEPDPDVERIVGIDVEDPPSGSPKLEFHRVDVRDPQVAKAVAATDVLVHLAYALDPMRDERLMRDINVGGTQNVLDAAASVGVPRLVYVSSGMVYGAHADNEVPLTERSALRANKDFAYAAHKLESEIIVAEFASANAATAVAVFRPSIVFGPNVENFLSRALEAPRVFGVRGFRPPLQLVHEEDIAEALALAVRERVAGVYNVAADGWLEPSEVDAIVGKRRIELPESAAFSLAERVWRSGLSESPPGELHYHMHPWLLSNERLRSLGWAPRHSNRDTLVETLTAHQRWVSLGRARVRKGDLARGAAATIGAVGAVALARRARRRRT